MDSTLRLTHAVHQELAREALGLWLPSATLLFEPMPGGRSGAELVSVDISGDTGDIPAGTYVLRVGPEEEDLTQANELAAHQLIRSADPAFAERHVPRLLHIAQRHQDDVRVVVSLHQLAGDSLSWYVPPRSGSTGLLRCAHTLARDLMDAWADPSSITRMRPRDLLLDIAGETRLAACEATVPALFSGEMHQEDGHAFLNPLTVLGEAEEGGLPVMGGICHGDLNTGNVLVPRDEVEADDDAFWIVDVDQARRSVAGYDLAYLWRSASW
ncbi:phosphotransferase [Streptomyces sp. 2RAF24]|uniref:phosphotransferase n=1 Tax=Streptomyces sp. 2RAF24 TaxID=3232997 RepID=UPI003F9BE503